MHCQTWVGLSQASRRLSGIMKGIRLHQKSRLATSQAVQHRMFARSAGTIQNHGLAGVVVGESTISSVGQYEGDLIYRGYSIKDLTEHCMHEEVIYLLLFGKLPSESELFSYRKKMASMRALPDGVKRVLETLPQSANSMDVLRTGCSALGVLEPETDAATQQFDAATRVISCLPSMLFYWYHYSTSGKKIDTVTDPNDSIAEHFLKLLHQDDKIDPELVKGLHAAYILYCEHDLNASTFVSRIAAATKTDIHSAFTAAICTMRGDLHGGACQLTMEMLERFDSPSSALAEVDRMLSRKELVMGFGHRVYKHAPDPRSPIARRFGERLVSMRFGKPLLFEIAQQMERKMAAEKQIYPNVELYGCFLFRTLGIPVSLFGGMIVLSRAAGWAAHIVAQRADSKLIRPVSAYVGPAPRPFVPLSERPGPVISRSEGRHQ